MAIYAPGRRNRKKKRISRTSRRVLAALSLTAMVDLFTVLVVFLLQNYNLTGQVIHLPKNVALPRAVAVKELKPAHIVMIANGGIHVDDLRVAGLDEATGEDWMIRPLFDYLRQAFEADRIKSRQGFRNKVRSAVRQAKQGVDVDREEYRKVTVQADKRIRFGVIKRIMYTIVEAGAGEVNFAVERHSRKKL